MPDILRASPSTELRVNSASREVPTKNIILSGKFSPPVGGSNNNSGILFKLLIICILILAIYLRFFDYYNRILIHSDHSLFAQAAIFSARTFTTAQIGPFAQSTFFTGPWWLWILGIFYLFPFGVLAPWYFMSIFSLAFMFLLYIVGREVGGKWLGALAALYSGISIAQIDNSLSLWNAAFDPLAAALGIYFLIKFYETKRTFFVFLLSFIVGMAATVHFAAGLLLPMILVALVTTRPKFRYFVGAFLGLLIPFIPFLIFDLRFRWFWVKSVWIYVTVDQYRFWVPNRWLTYAFSYWPETWGYILGIGRWFAFFLMGLLAILILVRLRDAARFKIFFLLVLSFFLEVVMFRYHEGQRFVYFSNFAHPSVFLLTAWVVVELFKIKKPLGALVGILIFMLATNTALENLQPRDITYPKIVSLKNEIYNKLPGENFDIYGCPFGGPLVSHPLAYLIYFDNRESLEGAKIGVCYSQDKNITWTEISDEQINAEGSAWTNRATTEEVFRSMTEWWKTNPPK